MQLSLDMSNNGVAGVERGEPQVRKPGPGEPLIHCGLAALDHRHQNCTAAVTAQFRV